MGITFLTDPGVAAAEIRRNAERGFTSVSLPERPQRIGLPSLFSGYWDPVIAACAATHTVISLHVGSSGNYEAPDDAGPRRMQLTTTLFGQLSLAAAAEWLWSGYPVKHPDLKIAMSEGGIGWVPMLLERLDGICDRGGYGNEGMGGMRPADVLRRNFWFCTIEDVAAASGSGHRWFQLYWPKDDEITISLLSHAENAGYKVLLVTLDTWALGWRPWDLDHAYIPPSSTASRSRTSCCRADPPRSVQASLADQPPSTGITAPLTNDALSDTRKAATSATSCGCPPLFNAAFSRMPGVYSGCAPMISVWMKPGHMTLTRMPFGPYSTAAHLEAPMTPARVRADSVRP